MAAVEERVVAMKFDNAEFERRAASTLKQLEALNKGLALTGATKGLHDLGAASKSVDLSHAEKGVTSLSDKLKAMSVVGVTALATLTSKALETGTRIAKAFTIDPLTSGFKEYETNLNSIQTVLANTSKAGTTLKDVNKALAELNEYSDQTIYNFSEMAKNIGTFTAAGVSLDTATASIKGIANLAALSGANSEQASRAMYQLSQAISAGKVSLEDWNSVVQAGMGGKVFQDALMQTARVHGVAIDQMVKDAGSFRLTLQEGWLTGEILTETLMQFTGDLTDAQLKSMGYSQAQIAEIQKLAAIAKAAATEVKTFSQLMSTLQEGLGSGWARTWELIFGDFEEAKQLWTGVNNVIGEFIKTSSDARNKVIGDWKELGGRTVLIEGLALAFNLLMEVVTPIGKAFRDIFPPITGQQLYNLTVQFRDFFSAARLGEDTMNNIRRTFAGVFAILDVGWTVVKEGVKFLFELFGVVTEGSGGILEATANFGDFAVGLRNSIKAGQGIQRFFEILMDVVRPPIEFVKTLGSEIGKLLNKFDGVAAAKGLSGFIAKLASLEGFGERIKAIWSGVFSFLDNIFIKFFGVAGGITEFFEGFGEKVVKSLQGINLQGIVGVFTGGAFAALLLSLRNMIGGAADILDSLTDSLSAMQTTLRAATLLQIALAVGVLTASVAVLSGIDAAGLTRSLTAITVMFTQLLASLLIFEKLSGFTGFAKMPFVAASMILLGVAVNVLALAVKQLADLNWDELSRGLTGVMTLLGMIIITAHLMPNPASFISTGAGVVVLAAGIKILASAVNDLSGLSWDELARGLVGVGTLLGALTLFTMYAKANATGVLAGAGIVLLAAGIKILAGAVKDMAEMSWSEIGRGLTVLAGALTAIGLALTFIPPTAPLVAAGIAIVALSLGLIGDAIKDMGDMSWGDIGKGLTVLAGALTAIGLALTLIPPTAPLTALGIVMVAAALKTMGEAIEQMGQMGWDEIGKGLTTLAGALLAISIAVIAMSGAVTGALAIAIVAASLALLTPVLMVFSQMSWTEIAKGLTMLAGVFVVLGVAGLALTPLVPTLIGLGAAITLLGIGMLAAGAGLLLFSIALTGLAAAGAAGTAALVAMVGALAGLIPEVMKQVGLGVVAFAQAIAAAAPAVTGALIAILNSLIDAIVTLTPKIVDALLTLLSKLLDAMLKHVPKMVDTGLKLVAGFLQGVANNIGKVVDAATNLAVNFLDALGRNQPKVIQAGVNYIINFVNGVANAIRSNSAAMGEAGANLGSAIVEGMVRGLAASGGRVASMARDVASRALNAAKSLLGISSPSKEFRKIGEWSGEGMALGLESYATRVENSAFDVGNGALQALRKSVSNMADIVSSDIDTTPTIRPVLDLTEVKAGAGQISGLFASKSLSVNGNYSSAKYVSGAMASDADTGSFDSNDETTMSPITFNQYNTSPKALSTGDIYRNTKSQLSTAKEALTPNVGNN